MELLKFFEGIRTPLLDAFFSIITHFGAETVFVIVCFTFLWCVNKKDGYYLLALSFFGLLINQFLKITFRIPRPWVKDDTFTIVPSAREDAVGYSFPSGHSQISVGTFGFSARMCKNTAIKIVSLLLCILVPLSRMYLGVHTLADVLVSVLIAILLIFLVKPVVYKAFDRKWGIDALFASMLVLSALYILYLLIYPFPPDADETNLSSSIDFAYKMSGLVLGGWLGFAFDRRFVRYTTDAPFEMQCVKVVGGLLCVFAIKEGLSVIFDLLSVCKEVSDIIRYMMISLFACGIWPKVFMCFPQKQ